MSKILLISYAGYPYTPSCLMPDNGLANLAGQLISKSHTPLILDYGTISTMKRLFPKDLAKKIKESMKNKDFSNLERLNLILENDQKEELKNISSEIILKIKEFKPDIVGFKLWWGDGFLGSLYIAKKIKEFDKNLTVVGGGPHVDYFRELIFSKTDNLDILSYGDGENTILDLVDFKEGKKMLKDIKNIIYKENGKIIINDLEYVRDLNSIAMPVYDYEVYPSMQGNEKVKIVTIDESRGCPFDCSFCIQPLKSGKFLRNTDPKRVVDIMKNLKEKYNIKVFRFAGSATPGKQIQAIGEEIFRRNLDVNYSSFARVNYANAEFFNTMKKSGLQSLFFGVESGSQKILDKAFNKRVKVEDMKKVLIASREAGIYTIASIILPAPFETSETIEETFNFLKETKPDSVIINPIGIFPYTEWFFNPKKFGIEINSEGYLKELMSYKPMLLFPPNKWKSLPYKVNGKSFKELAEQSSNFIQRLEKEGIFTMVPDDMYMMSWLSENDSKFFRDMCRKYINAGDYEGIQNLIKEKKDN